MESTTHIAHDVVMVKKTCITKLLISKFATRLERNYTTTCAYMCECKIPLGMSGDGPTPPAIWCTKISTSVASRSASYKHNKQFHINSIYSMAFPLNLPPCFWLPHTRAPHPRCPTIARTIGPSDIC